MKTFSVVIPIYNEERYLNKYLKQLIRQLKTLGLDFEIILSENGSTDKTWQITQALARQHKYIQALHNPQADYGLAVKNGFLKAQGKFLVLFDLDYWSLPFLRHALPRMVVLDAIIGAKRGRGAQDNRTFNRKIITLLFSLLLKFLFGMKISDTHGIKILNRKKFLPIIHKCLCTKEIFDTELLIRSEYEGLNIGEIGVHVQEKRKSRTSILKRAIRTLKDLVYLKQVLEHEYRIQNHFNKIASDYDFYKQKNQFYYHNLKTLLQSLIQPSSRVLEVGCGTGDLLASLKPQVGLGLDLSPEMINLAKAKHHQNNLSFSTKELSAFLGKKFDYIFMSDVIEHLPNPTKIFQDINKLMTPKTQFICTMANPKWEPFLMIAEIMKLKMPEGPHHRWSLAQTNTFLTKSGMKSIKHDYLLLAPIKIPFLTSILNNYLESRFKNYAFIEYFVCTKK